MLKGVVLPLLFLITVSTFAQELQPDSIVVDSLEVLVAEEDHMYKGDTADFVYFVLPTELEYIPGDDSRPLWLTVSLALRGPCR
jgi:membrane-bound lytic murein transglycosylase D